MKRKKKGDIERRQVALQELRVEGGDSGRRIVGHAAMFNQLSVPLWGFRERIQPGAFKKTLAEADVRALWNHDPNFVFGRNKADTLRLAEDDVGLSVEVFPPATQWARDFMVSIDRGDVDQMSFAFEAIQEEWATENGEQIRSLVEVRLQDVSFVTFPAYPQTDAQVRGVCVQCGGQLNQEMECNVGLGTTTPSRILQLTSGTADTNTHHIRLNTAGLSPETNHGNEHEFPIGPAGGGHLVDGSADLRTRMRLRKRRLELLNL